MNVLVTGGAGFIGSHLVRRLIGDGHHVCVLDRFHDDDDPHVRWSNLSQLLTGDDLELVVGSVTDAESVGRSMRTRGGGPIEAVVHLASATTATTSHQRPVECIDCSVNGTSILLEAMSVRQIARLVLASSSSVYGEVEGAMAEDSQPGRPRSPYGVSKRAMEGLGELYAGQSGLQVTALRLFSVYGPGVRRDAAIAAFQRAISAGEPVTLFGDGTAVRDLIHVDDVVRCIVAALQRPGPAFRVYNVGRGEPVRVREVVEAIEATLDRRATCVVADLRPGDLTSAVAMTERARKELGFTASIGWREGLDDLCRTTALTTV